MKSKTLKAWAILDRKNIMFIGCENNIHHLEIFPTKKEARVADDPESGFKNVIVPCTITYTVPSPN